MGTWALIGQLRASLRARQLPSFAKNSSFGHALNTSNCTFLPPSAPTLDHTKLHYYASSSHQRIELLRQPKWPRPFPSARSRATRARTAQLHTRTSKDWVCSQVMDAQVQREEASSAKLQLARYASTTPQAANPSTNPTIGMRLRRRSRKGKEDVWQGCASRWRTWNRKDSSCARRQPGIGDQGTVLSYRGQRDILCRGEEDGGAYGELQAGDR